jgi:hypothetical protein
MSRLIRMDRTGHTTRAEWSAEARLRTLTTAGQTVPLVLAARRM